MKSTKNLFLLLFVAAALVTSSCSKDDAGNSFGTSTGNFLPLAVGNTWSYAIANQSNTNTITITGTENIGGTTYYEFFDDETFGLDLTQFFAKKGATYVSRVGETNVNQDGIIVKIGAYELPILKDDAAIGSISTGSISPKVTISANGQNSTIPFKVDYILTTLSKESLVIDSVTYPNVIKSRIKIIINANGEITENTQDYWFAENVGIVKTITNDGNVIADKTLVSYNLN